LTFIVFTKQLEQKAIWSNKIMGKQEFLSPFHKVNVVFF